MSKFKEGQKCRVTKNLLAPHCIGQTVIIIRVANKVDGRVLYEISDEGLHGYAMESCLEEINEQQKER